MKRRQWSTLSTLHANLQLDIVTRRGRSTTLSTIYKLQRSHLTAPLILSTRNTASNQRHGWYRGSGDRSLDIIIPGSGSWSSSSQGDTTLSSTGERVSWVSRVRGEARSQYISSSSSGSGSLSREVW